MVEQGDIIWIDFDEPARGHEQGKRRPAVVVSNRFYNARVTNIALVCPITSVEREYPSRVKIDTPGMKTVGMIQCEQLRAVDYVARNYAVIEKLPDHILNKVITIIELAIQRPM